MKRLMQLYDVLSLEDKKLVEKTLLSLINNRDYKQYLNILTIINNRYNYNGNHNMINYSNNERYTMDIETYLNERYLKIYANAKDGIFFEPITIELLNNEYLYNKYVRPLTNLSKEECFCKIEQQCNYNLTRFIKLVDNSCANYDNPYYNELMLSYFRKIVGLNGKLSMPNISRITHFFVCREAHDNNLYIRYELIKITDRLKELLRSKDKNLALQRLKRYGKVMGTQFVSFDGYSEIAIHISKHRALDSNSLTLSALLSTIYHECRHAKQSLKEDNYRVREDVIVNLEKKFYDDNHNSFDVEIDAEIYAIDKTRDILELSFPNIKTNIARDNAVKLFLLTSKYKRKLEFENKVDELLFKHSTYIKGKPQLEKEYNLNGLPKDIFEILEQRKYATNEEIITYNEIITRCLNRMSQQEYEAKLRYIASNNFLWFQYISSALDYKLDEIANVYKQIEIEVSIGNLSQKEEQDYLKKIETYSNRIMYYNQQIMKLAEERVAKR